MDNVTRVDALIQYTNKKGSDIEDWDEILPNNLLVYDEASNIIKKGNGAYTFTTLPIWLNLAELETLSNVGNYIEKNIFISDNVDKLLIITKDGYVGISDVLTNTTLSMLLANISTILEIGGGVNIRPPVIIGKQRKNIDTILELEAVSFTAYDGEKLIDYIWTLPDDSIVPGNTLDYIIPDDTELLGTTLTFKCRAVSHEFDFISKYSTHVVTVAADEDGVVTSAEIIVPTFAPSINDITWDNDDQYENESYVMTIDATDPGSLELTYGVVCNDGTVGIVQRAAPNENIFDITYGEYSGNTNIEYTVTVTNTIPLSDVDTEAIIIHILTEAPVINTISWDDDDHDENESYVMTIGATDPNSQDLTYDVTCDDGTVGIVQRGTTNIFDITYGEYASDTDVEYTITVTNEDTLTDVETEVITVHNVVIEGDRGIFAGGNTIGHTASSIIEHIAISSIGNSSSFGNLTIARAYVTATSNGINDRGVVASGHTGVLYLDTIDYITILSAGNAIDFGNLASIRSSIVSASNGTNDRGIFACGSNGIVYFDTIDYITITSLGDVTSFGNLLGDCTSGFSTSNGVNDRCIIGAGWDDIALDTIEYITISSTGNSADFGDLTVARRYTESTSNGINDRGVIAGGYNGTIYFDTIDYVTISTLGDATDFGDLTEIKRYASASSNTTNERAVFGGARDGANTAINNIDYITISTPGDASDFGDLISARYGTAATSNA